MELADLIQQERNAELLESIDDEIAASPICDWKTLIELT